MCWWGWFVCCTHKEVRRVSRYLTLSVEVCANTALFKHTEYACVAFWPLVFVTVSQVYMGFKGMTHHISRCPYASPFLVFVFLFTSSHFHLLILFLGPFSIFKKSCLQEQELLNFLVLSHHSTVENAWLAVSEKILGGGLIRTSYTTGLILKLAEYCPLPGSDMRRS